MTVTAPTISRRSLTSGIAVTLAAGVLPLSASRLGAQDITTRIQFLHAGTDTGEVEVHINGDEVLDEFGYGDTSDWIDLDPGSVRVTVTADRAGFNYAILDTVYPVPAGNDYYAIISDVLLLGGAFDVSSMPGDGSRVQVTHASVDTPAVDVVASGESVDLATQLGYTRTSEAAPLPAGTYDLEVALSDSGEPVLTKTGVVIDPGKSYQAVLVGTPGDDDKPLDIVLLATDLSTGGERTAAAWN
jgi:hypothetical protein